MKKSIIIHCSDVSEKLIANQFDSVNRYHRDDRKFPVSSLGIYVGYNSFITGGKNYKCRDDFEIGCHCNQEMDDKGNIYPYGSLKALSMNIQSFGVCVGFDGDIETMSDVHYELLKKQVWEWQDKYNIPNEKVFFHRKFATDKTCPGKLLTDSWLAKLLNRGNIIPTESCMSEMKVIETQKQQIFNLQVFIRNLIAYFKK